MIEWMLTVKHDGTEAMDKLVTFLAGRPWNWKTDEGGESTRTWLFASQQEALEAERRLMNIPDFRTSLEEVDREALENLLREYLDLTKPTEA
jgi:hypothetical protein